MIGSYVQQALLTVDVNASPVSMRIPGPYFTLPTPPLPHILCEDGMVSTVFIYVCSSQVGSRVLNQQLVDTDVSFIQHLFSCTRSRLHSNTSQLDPHTIICFCLFVCLFVKSTQEVGLPTSQLDLHDCTTLLGGVFQWFLYPR